MAKSGRILACSLKVVTPGLVGVWARILGNVACNAVEGISCGDLATLGMCKCKKPRAASRGFLGSCIQFGLLAAAALLGAPAADSLLATGAIHQAGPEVALFQPLQDLVLREADVRFNPHIRYESALDIAINGLHVNL